MIDRKKIGADILKAAAVTGVAGNLLLREPPWGLNAFLFVALFVAGMATLTYRHHKQRLTAANFSLWAAMLFFASMFVIRSSETLLIFDTLAIIVLMGVLVLPNFGLLTQISGVIHYFAGVIWAGVSSIFGPIVLLIFDVKWKSESRTGLSGRSFAILRGLVIAIPLIFVFGALFMAADSKFEEAVNRLIYFEVDTVVSHIVLSGVFAWLVAGYFRGSLIEGGRRAEAPVSVVPKADAYVTDADLSAADDLAHLPDHATVLEHINRTDEPAVKREHPAAEEAETGVRDWQNLTSDGLPRVFTLGTTEIVVVLGLVNVLFAAFVSMQLPYLFGGIDLVQQTPDLKLADYARRGFGELVVVAALVLPMLLASQWLVRKSEPRARTAFNILAVVQIGLLFVVMSSAVQRLLILTGENGYGLTQVRFYPMVFMIWLAIVFIWFAATVLRGRRDLFAWGALWAAVVVLGIVNLMNPASFIARTNLERVVDGRTIDIEFNYSLSEDAMADLLNGIAALPEDERCRAKVRLHWRLLELENSTADARSFNLARYKALRLLRENDEMLHRQENCPPVYTIPTDHR